MMSKESNHGTFRMTEAEAPEDGHIWERFPVLPYLFGMVLFVGLALLAGLMLEMRGDIQELKGGEADGGVAHLREELAELKRVTQEADEKAAEERRSIRKSLSGVWHQHDAASLDFLKAYAAMSEEERKQVAAALGLKPVEVQPAASPVAGANGSEEVAKAVAEPTGAETGAGESTGSESEPAAGEEAVAGTVGGTEQEEETGSEEGGGEPSNVLDLDLDPSEGTSTASNGDEPGAAENDGGATTAENAEPAPGAPEGESDLETGSEQEPEPDPARVVKPEPAPVGKPEPEVAAIADADSDAGGDGREAGDPKPAPTEEKVEPKEEPKKEVKADPKPEDSGVASYTVKSGDSLSKIAQQHGVTARALARANKLRNVNSLQIGQVLKIPRKE